MEVGFGLISEFAGSTGDVSERVFDVTGAFRSVARLRGEAELASNGGVDLVEGVTFSCTDIENAAGGDLAGGKACEKIRADGVVDVVEVAASEAVSEDGRGFACHHFEGELRDDAGIRRIGRRAGVEDGEVAQADAFKTIGAVEGLNVVLAGKLLDSVGRQRTRKH